MLRTRFVALLLLAACAVNPATGRRELSLVSESQEIQMGQQGKQDVQRSIGIYQDSALGAYVAQVGMRIARGTERPNLPWSFQIADEPVVNAFALPGGPVFIARGILPYFNSEAELVSVLGHEIGHVTARHSAQQMTRAQIATLGLGVASIADARVAKYAGLAQQGLGLLLLKYGRDAEAQADALGFRYGLKNGYDMREGTAMFNTLARVSGDPGQRLPEWQSTHPAPEGRAEHNAERVRAAEAQGVRFDTLRVDRDGYLRRLEGLVYGADPRAGYFDGSVFYHPTLRLRFTFPDGWKTQNGTDAVVGMSAAQDALIAFSAAGTDAPDAAARAFAAQQGLEAAPGQGLTINGLPAWTLTFQAATDQGTVTGRATWIAYGGTTWRLLGYTTPDKVRGYDAAFLASARSFGPLTDPARLNVQPRRVHIVQLRAPQTVVQAGRANGNTIPDAELASLNSVGVDEVLPAGRLVKVVR
jgi:predicted Zn-dependent protease